MYFSSHRGTIVVSTQRVYVLDFYVKCCEELSVESANLLTTKVMQRLGELEVKTIANKTIQLVP